MQVVICPLVENCLIDNRMASNIHTCSLSLLKHIFYVYSHDSYSPIFSCFLISYKIVISESHENGLQNLALNEMNHLYVYIVHVLR